MLLSVFTPTNNPQYLEDCLQSLEVQKYENWEWIVAPNGDAIDALPSRVTRHQKTRVCPYTGEAKIGALKRFCCEQAKGAVYIELDHDDLLVPGILEKIADAASRGAGFIYSDAAVFSEGQSPGKIHPIGYNENYGWETYSFRVYGKDFIATRAFDISARSLCEVYYAPDHVRCWSAEAYKRAGGHDAELEVGDDHDLICRTYLAGIKFAHTNSCGYLYRTHPGNTVKSHNAKIQEQQYANRDKYLYQLIDAWTAKHRLGYLDLRWGDSSEHLEFTDDGVPTILCDDDIVGSIRAYDLVQRLNPTQVQQFMEECYRVLSPGGWLCLSAPSTAGAGGFQPYTKSFWNPTVIDTWCLREHADMMGNSKARFQKVRCFTQISVDREIPNVPYVYADLCALKGQRQPGRVRI